MAHKRIMIGVSNSSEEYRWESLIANQKQDVVNANLRISLAILELNRLLNRPLKEEFILEEVGLENSIFGIVEGRILELTDNPKSMQVFSDFIAELALKNSSQLKQIKKSMDAVKRTIASTKRSFWLPTFVIQGQVERTLVKEGEGTEGLDLSAMGVSTVVQDDTNFSISALLSWSVFEGGQRVAELRKYRAQLVQLEIQFEATKQLIEQRLRAALWNGRASGISIVLAHKAAQASKKNLELVTDAYSRGALTILDLLDAQNTALVSELAAVNARFTLMIDMIKIQRVAEIFFAVEGKENTTQRIRQLEEYLKKHDAMPPIRGNSPFKHIQ